MEELEVLESKDTNEEETPQIIYKQMSPGRLVMRRFFRSKLSIVGLVMIGFLFVFSFLGPIVFRQWGEIDVDQSTGKTIITETIYEYEVDGEKFEMVLVFEKVLTENIYDYPSASHWFGTDDKGMDVFARLMYGGRVSLLIGFIVIILETVIGIFFGGLAGYFGKWVDQIIMRIVDIFNCIPTLPILLIAGVMLDSWDVALQHRIYYLMIILTIFGWSGTARMVRGQILSLREQEYMVATEAMGLPVWRRIFKHLIPNVLPQLIVSMTLGLGGIILYESTLSFLGLGVPMPYAAWGSMISVAGEKIEVLMNYPHMWIPPGIAIVLAVLGFNFIGDGLRDAFDPKMKR